MTKLIKKNWKQTLWKTLNVISSVALIANMSMIGVFVAPKVASATTYCPSGNPLYMWDRTPNASWSHGQISGYFEGEYIPVQLELDGLTSGVTTTLRVEHQYIRDSVVGVERLDHVNAPIESGITFNANRLNFSMSSATVVPGNPSLKRYTLTFTPTGSTATLYLDALIGPNAHLYNGASLHVSLPDCGSKDVPIAVNQILYHSLTITKTDNPDPIQLNANTTYTITATSNSKTDGGEKNFTVTDTLPAGMSYVAGSASPAPTSVVGQVITWNFGTVADGTTKIITFQATGIAVGTHTNTASVKADGATPVTDTEPTTVLGQCNLTISKSVNNITHPNGPNVPGDVLEYSILFGNNGTADCTGGGVRIDDVIPTGTTYVNNSASGYDGSKITNTNDAGNDGTHFGYTAGKFGPNNSGYNGSMLSWNAHVLSPTESGTVKFRVTVNNLAECQNITIKNSGKIYSNENTVGVTSNEVQTPITAPCSTTLKVIKHVVNDNGGTKTASDFTMKVTEVGGLHSFAGSESGTTMDVTPGAYSVSEDSVYGYQAQYSADCSGTIALGEDKVCTVTNNDIKPKLTVTKVVINDNGGTAVTSDFPLFVDQTSVTSGVQNSFNAGTYTVSETNKDGYTSAINGDCAANGSVTLNVGDVKSCTITNNDKAAKLVVTKHVINDNGGTKVASDFTINVTGSSVSPASFAGNEGGSEVTLNAGSYSVDESAMTGYAKTIGAKCSGTIANGETKYCTITNDDIAPKLKIVKTVTNDNGGTKQVSDFPLFIGQTQVTSGQWNTVTANIQYTVYETNLPGYQASAWGTDCAANGTITLQPGDQKICTINNNDIQPKLTVTKVVINDNGGTAVVADFPLFVGLTSVTSGVQNGFNVGNYTISETNKTGYSGSITGDCDSQGNVTLNIGDAKSCTITNNDIAPKLKLVKTVINDNGGTKQISDFPLFINGNPVTSGEWNTVMANVQYTASETNLFGYQATAWGGDCGRTGTITLQPGDTKVCTITNDDIQPKLTVTKIVINDNGGTAVVADFPLFVGATSVTSGAQNGFNANSYVVSETNKDGYTAAISGDCDTNGNVTLGVGDVKSCTITNDDISPKLTVIKHVDNNNVGTADASDFTMNVTGTKVSNNSFPGDESGVTVTLNQGAYSVDENQYSGYTKSFNGDCSGTINVGEEKTCTITNTAIKGHIDGYKYEDTNGNGDFDQGDTAVANWPISLYMKVEGNWVLQGSAVLTDVNGYYQFGSLDKGDYKVAENPILPWVPVIPDIEGYEFSVTPGFSYQYDFLNYQLGSISGYKWNDMNGNGVWDQDEPGIHDWSISLNGPKTGTVATDQNGYYKFENLPIGTYSVSEDATNSAWFNTTPSTISNLTIQNSNTNLTDNNFGNFKYGKISGYKYDNHENGLAGWQICLTQPNTFSTREVVSDANCVLTDANGYYEFDHLTYGTYYVSETLKYGWVQLSPTDPNWHTVNVVSGTDSQHNDFVNRMNEFGVDIQKSGPATVNAGENISYTLDWSVTGNTPVYNAKVTDVLPANTTFVSADNGGTYDDATKTITWDLGTVNPDQSGIVHLVVKSATPLDNGTVIENTGKICGTGYLPLPQVLNSIAQQGTEKCDTSTTTTTTKSAPVLGITKTNDKPVGLPGDKVNYTIKWSVDGNSKATNVTLTDTVPVELTLDTGTISNGGTYNASTRIITWNLGTQVPHAEGTVTYSGNIVSPLANGTQIVNVAKITSTETDPKFWEAQSITTVKSAPILVITKVVTPTETVADSQVTYTVVIKNTGNDTAINVKMTDLLPTGFTFVEFGGSSHTYTLGNLAAGAQTTVTYKVNVGKDVAAGTYDNLAVASADNHPNVSAIAKVKIGVVLGEEALPKLTITKTADAKFINPGGHVTYHVTITNIGDAPAINVQLQDVMPAGFTFDVGGITKIWSLGDLAVGASVKVAYTAIADKTVLPGNYENIAVAWADNNDKVTATVPVEVRAVQVLGAELPETGAGIQDYFYFFAASMLLLFALFLLKLTFNKESE